MPPKFLIFFKITWGSKIQKWFLLSSPIFCLQVKFQPNLHNRKFTPLDSFRSLIHRRSSSYRRSIHWKIIKILGGLESSRTSRVVTTVTNFRSFVQRVKVSKSGSMEEVHLVVWFGQDTSVTTVWSDSKQSCHFRWWHQKFPSFYGGEKRFWVDDLLGQSWFF